MLDECSFYFSNLNSKVIFKLFRIALCFLAPALAFSQKNWELAKQKDGVKVFSRYNEKNVLLKELKTIAVFPNTKLSTIFSVFNDVNNTTSWTQDLKVSKILKVVSEVENYEYYQIFIPWPLFNRDIIYNIKYHQDPKDNALHLVAVNVPEYLPENKNIIRIRDSFGFWKFTPVSNGSVLVENYLYGDPIGLPAWVVNVFAVESPLKVMMALREFVKLPKYQNKKYSFIKE